MKYQYYTIATVSGHKQDECWHYTHDGAMWWVRNRREHDKTLTVQMFALHEVQVYE